MEVSNNRAETSTHQESTSTTNAETIDRPEDKNIDKLLSNLGTWGRFQIVLILSCFLVVFSTSYNFLLSYFTSDDPPWTCVTHQSNTSSFCRNHVNETFHRNKSQLFNQRCKLPRDQWTYVTSKHYSYVTEFDLVCVKKSTAAWATATYYIGGIFGAGVGGMGSDLYGRKPVILISMFITICASVGITMVGNVWQFCCVNVVLGAVTVSAYLTTIVYLTELSSPKHRSVLCTLILAVPHVSFIALDAVAYFFQNLQDWRQLQTYLTVSTIIASILPTLLPESVRWLLAAGQVSQAKDVLSRINRFNGRKLTNITLKPDTTDKSTTGTTTSSATVRYTYIDLCRDKKKLISTASICLLWMVIAVVEYSIALECSLIGGSMYTSFALSTLAIIPSSITSTFISQRYGRRKCTLGGLTLSGTLIGLVIAVPRRASWRYTANLLILTCARVGNMTAFYGVYVWTFELFPTVLRSQGVAVCAVFERMSLVAVPFITKVLESWSYVVPFVVLCVLSLCGAGVGTVLPETHQYATQEQYEELREITIGNCVDTEVGIDNAGVEREDGVS